MEIKITGTPEEVKKLLAELAGKELVTKDSERNFNWAKGRYEDQRQIS
ncbi:hypothetical protein [Limosilactobacillus ingluviei]|nr:hypothetical protein [Limosilactobacillus ingluviei]